MSDGVNNNLITFADYQAWQLTNNPGLYPLKGNNLVFPAMGLAGESGKLLDKIKKHWRNTTNQARKGNERLYDSPLSDLSSQVFAMSAITLTHEQRQAIIEEMGDVLWYLYAMCNELDIALGEVAIVNIEKLKGRLSRGTTLGEGDKR